MATHMANGILNRLNQSLEITLRDGLDGLQEFALMMAATSLRPHYEILPGTCKPSSVQRKRPEISLIEPLITPSPATRNQKRRRA